GRRGAATTEGREKRSVEIPWEIPWQIPWEIPWETPRVNSMIKSASQSFASVGCGSGPHPYGREITRGGTE
ncbi:MAG: hypothetical protein WBE97_12640, partial [Candidatus Acidiferrales bacterium]